VHAGRAALTLALVGLGGLAAGFFSYRLAQRPATHVAAVAATATTAQPPDAPGQEPVAPVLPPVPAAIPAMTLPDPTGQRHALREYVGHALIINFWATWCDPCRREMPLLSRLWREHRQDGLQIVGIAVDFGAAVKDYLRTSGVPYPILIAEQDGLAAMGQFGMEPVLPFSVFADREGRIVAVKAGELHPEDAADILGTLREVDTGQLGLPAAREQLQAQLAARAAARARAQQNAP